MAVWPRAVSPLFSVWGFPLPVWKECTAESLHVVIQRDWVRAAMGRWDLSRQRLRNARHAAFSLYAFRDARSESGGARRVPGQPLGQIQRGGGREVVGR